MLDAMPVYSNRSAVMEEGYGLNKPVYSVTAHAVDVTINVCFMILFDKILTMSPLQRFLLPIPESVSNWDGMERELTIIRQLKT